MAADINTSISELKTSLDASTAAIASMTTAFNSGILSLVNGLASIDCSDCPPTGTYPPTDGIDEEDPPPAGFDDYDPGISDRKCKLANMYFDDLHQVTTLLEANGIDDIGALALGSMTALLGLLLGVIATGPVGWGLGALGAIAGVVSFFLLESVDLEDLLLILNAEQEDLVCSLYEATTPAGGLVAFKAVLAAGGANAAQLAYFDAVNMVVALETLFFKPDGSYGDDIESRLDGFVGTIDCVACSQVGGCPWEFEIIGGDPAGSGDLTKNGVERTLSSAFVAGDNNLRIQLDTVAGWPGEDCGGETYVNARVEILSMTEPILWSRHWKWVGPVRTDLGGITIPLDEDVEEIRLRATNPFTIQAILYSGDT